MRFASLLVSLFHLLCSFAQTESSYWKVIQRIFNASVEKSLIILDPFQSLKRPHKFTTRAAAGLQQGRDAASEDGGPSLSTWQR